MVGWRCFVVIVSHEQMLSNARDVEVKGHFWSNPGFVAFTSVPSLEFQWL